jgi:glyoxylase-like metal-dependent hydrolase (beta-lactamase superfamily II)
MKEINRRKFIASAISAGGLLCIDKSVIGNKDNQPEMKHPSIRLKGSLNSPVRHWDIITIGNLSRNRYWGESDERPLHSAICTCTVVIGDNFRLIVDPSIDDEANMSNELKRRTGLAPGDFDHVFITHTHSDHVAGLRHFTKARWMAGKMTASELNKSNNFPKIIETADNNLFGVIDVVETKGHSPDHTSLRFDYRGLSVVIAGDAVATYDFWLEKRMYYNVMDPEEAKKSLEKINSIANVVIPGHDNYFLNL